MNTTIPYLIKDLPVQIKNWFNTICFEGSDLLGEIDRCNKQQDAIYQVFKQNPGVLLTPFQVLKICIYLEAVGKNTPVTSIRRAMTNLTEAGLLVKTDQKIIEEYGKPNFQWKLFEPEVKQVQGKLDL